MLAITSARRTSLSGVALSDLTDPTMPVAFGGDKTRRGTLTRLRRGSWLGCLTGRLDAGAGAGTCRLRWPFSLELFDDLPVDEAGGGAREAMERSLDRVPLEGEDAEGRRGTTVDGVLAAVAVTLLR